LIQYRKEKKKKKKTACLGSLLFRLETNQIFGLSSFTHLSLKARPLSLSLYIDIFQAFFCSLLPQPKISIM
jgi:hypothetical protein